VLARRLRALSSEGTYMKWFAGILFTAALGVAGVAVLNRTQVGKQILGFAA
jgi:hypothetical protein